MKSTTHMNINRGFGALVAVLLLAFGTMALSLTTLAAAALYADGVARREMRIQDTLNRKACMDTAGIMADKGHFLRGTTTIPVFDCTVFFVESGPPYMIQ